MTTTQRQSRPPEGGDPTAASEIEPPVAAVCEQPQTASEIAHSEIIATRVDVSSEKGFEVTVTLVGMRDGGERRRWLEHLLFGQRRPDTIVEEIDYRELPSGIGVVSAGKD